jgi:pilus assembly protein CpaE
MLRAIIICPDYKLGAALKDALADLGLCYICRVLHNYPNEAALMRVIRATAPQVVFLSIESIRPALELASALESNVPGIQMIAIGRNKTTQILEELIHSDVREFLPMPFHQQQVTDALTRIRKLVERKPPAIDSTDRLYSFLPAKAGVGASTIAVNASIAAAAEANNRVLLGDFDLNSGIVQFMLKLDSKYSVVEASKRAVEMDEHIWEGLVAGSGSLDVLGAGDGHPSHRLEPVQVQYLLDFARRHYRMICADLSGNMEQYALEIMQESKRIFLVCTPELPAMYLARKKYALLKSMDLADRVSLLLNRYKPGLAIGPAEMEETVGLPVAIAFPNDYNGVHAALSAGKQISAGSPLGRKLRHLAGLMLEKKPEGSNPTSIWPELLSTLTSRYAQLTGR